MTPHTPHWYTGTLALSLRTAMHLGHLTNRKPGIVLLLAMSDNVNQLEVKISGSSAGCLPHTSRLRNSITKIQEA